MMATTWEYIMGFLARQGKFDFNPARPAILFHPLTGKKST